MIARCCDDRNRLCTPPLCPLLRGKMTITVAMALSGLEPEQWNDGLKEIYMQGAILFPKSPSSLSLASSGASSYYSLESGISSMSPDSASYNQFLLNDLDVLGLDGIIQVQDINDDNIHNVSDNSVIENWVIIEKHIISDST